MLNVRRHLWKVNVSTFMKFICQSERSWLAKPLFYWYLSFYESLLKDWLAITSILVLIFGICRYCIKCNYLKKYKHFRNFLSIFGIFIKFWTFWKKRWHSQPMYFQNLTLSKIWLDECLDSLLSEHPSTVNMSKCPKHL